MKRTGKTILWISAGVACLTFGTMNPTSALAQQDKVDRITEAEDIPNAARKAPKRTQVLPPGGKTSKQKPDRGAQAKDRATAERRQRDAQQPRRNLDARSQTQHPTKTRPDADGRAARRGVAETDRRPTQSRQPQQREQMAIAPRQLGMELGAEQGRPLSVRNISPESAAAQIGLQSGDEVISLGGQRIANQSDFNRALEGQLVASRRNRNFQIPLVVRRNGQLQTYYWTNVALAMAGYAPLLNRYGYYVPERYTTGYRGPLGAPTIPNSPGGAYLGVELNREYPSAAIVSRVYEGTPAAEAGLQAGDRIWGLNNQRIESIDELIYWVARMEPGQRVEVNFDRPHSVDVVLGDRSETAASRSIADPKPAGSSQPAEAPGPSDALPGDSTETPQTEPVDN